MINIFYKNIEKTIKQFNKLSYFTKFFIFVLILLLLFLVLNKKNKYDYYNIENLDNIDSFDDTTSFNFSEKYSQKVDEEIFDKFYVSKYDKINLNKTKNNFEINEIKKIIKKNKDMKILDIGCGTGYYVNKFSTFNYDIVGIDKSKQMITKAKYNYPNGEFLVGDILNNNIFDINSFNVILCLNRNIYKIKNKNLFFENCYSLLNNNGILIINLVDRDNFKPYVFEDDSSILYNPEKSYKKKITQTIIKFGEDNEYISKYLLNNEENNKKNIMDNNAYSAYIEKFENFKTNKARENIINLYMPELEEILTIAESKGFEIYKKIDMIDVNYSNEYLYILKK